jgi:hypothetical protein
MPVFRITASVGMYFGAVIHGTLERKKPAVSPNGILLLAEDFLDRISSLLCDHGRDFRHHSLSQG